MSYIIPFLRYHIRIPSNLRKLSERIELELSGTSPLKGIQNISSAGKLSKPDEESFSDEAIPIDPDTEYTFSASGQSDDCAFFCYDANYTLASEEITGQTNIGYDFNQID